MTRRPLAPGWRAVRIAVLGGSSLALAVLAHIAGGGRLPASAVLAVTALVLGLVAVPLTMRRCRMRRLVPLLAAEQFAVHVLFSAAAAPPGCAAPAGSHHAVLVPCTSGAPVAADLTAAAGHGWGMWLGHAVAVVATAWLLARGEHWLWRVAARLVRLADPMRTSLTFGRAPAVALAPAPAVVRADSGLPARGPPYQV